MALAFVSYSRKDAIFARELIAAFEERKLETWIDWEDIPPSQDWLLQIQRGIESADSFIFLISPDSVMSRVCRDEIAHAVKNNKRLIPVVIRAVESSEVPPEISKLNWIFFGVGQDNFQSSFQKLLEAIHTDFEWVQAHRRLQVRALEWQRRNRDNSLLLRGKDLQLAEQQLVATASKDPQPTDLQRAYVLASRKQSDRQRRLLAGLSVGAAIIMCCLGSIGIYEAIRASNQAQIATENEQTAIRNEATAVSRQLAAEALNQLNLDPSLSFLLSLEALRSADTYEARNSIATDLTFSPYLSKFFYGNLNFTTSVAFSPDGKWLAAGSCSEIERGVGISLCAPDEIRMIDVATGEQTMIMEEAMLEEGMQTFSFVHSLAFSPDGLTLASGSDDGMISLWNLRTGQVLNPTLGNQNGKVLELLFDSSSTRLASADGTTVNIWEISTGKLLKTANGLTVSLLPDNRFVAISEISSYLQLVDMETGNLLGSPVAADGVVVRAQYSPASNLLAVAYENNSISVYELSGASRIIGPSKIHLRSITRLVFSPDGTKLASASTDKTIGLWDLKSGSTDILVGHTDMVNSVAFSPDGLWLVSGAGNWNNFSRDNRMILWDLKRHGTLGRPLSFGPDYVSALDINPQFTDMLAIGGKGNIYFWDWAKDEVIGQLPAENHGSIDFSPDGAAMVSAGKTGALTLWNLAVSPTQGSVLMESPEALARAKFSPDGSRIAVVDVQGNLTFWSTTMHQQLGPVIPTTTGIFDQSLVYSRDGNRLAVGGNEAVLINVSDGKEIARFSPLGESGGFLWVSDFTPDLLSFVSVGDVGRYNYLQNTFTGGLVGRPFLQVNLADYAVFNPDASLLAISDQLADTEGRPGGIIIWDALSQQAYGQPLYGSGGIIAGMTFTPDGKSLIVGETAGTIFIWDMDMESWKIRLCKMANRNLTPEEWNYYFPNDPYRTTCK